MNSYYGVSGLSESEMKRLYLVGMRPFMNTRALFSDLTDDYVYPSEPEPYSIIRIRFRTARNNADHVFYVSNGEKVLMDKVETSGNFDYYSIEIELDDTPVRYHFYIETGKMSVFYDRRGVTRDEQPFFDFRVIPGFSVPEWSRSAVIYQIYVDRFYNGDPKNDVMTNEYFYIGGYSEHVDDWSKYPAQMGVREFYGGDLKGVMDKLPYLKELGIEAIYFNPLFVSPSNHRYDIQDYDNIDPHIGVIVKDDGELLKEGNTDNKAATRYIERVSDRVNLEASNAMFAELVAKCHENGIKVIIDGVFNHCGSFNKWMDRECIYEDQPGYEKGAYVAQDSPYHTFFKFLGDDWPYNTAYDGWWGHDTLPKLNYEDSPELCRYILNIAKKWVSPPYNVDGWRLDVAADLGHSQEFNHSFWQDFRKAVKEANPEAIIIAENYGDSSSWLNGNEWDTIMNYDAFMEPVTWFLTGMQKHSDDYREDLLGNADAFWSSMCNNTIAFTTPSAISAMNELSNHDHSRFLTRTNHKVGRMNTLGCEAANQGVNKAVFREAVLMQFTWPGSPTIYYGDEAGVCGFTDPDNRRTFPWGNEDFELIDFHRAMIRIHKENEELRTGSVMKIAGKYDFISYARFNRNSVCIIIVNNGSKEEEVDISVWETGLPRKASLKLLMYTTANGFTTDPVEISVVYGRLQFTMPPTAAIVLKGMTD